MTASQDSLVLAPEPESPPSAYADQMPKLREFAALPDADPRRDAVREHVSRLLARTLSRLRAELLDHPQTD